MLSDTTETKKVPYILLPVHDTVAQYSVKGAVINIKEEY